MLSLLCTTRTSSRPSQLHPTCLQFCSDVVSEDTCVSSMELTLGCEHGRFERKLQAMWHTHARFRPSDEKTAEHSLITSDRIDGSRLLVHVGMQLCHTCVAVEMLHAAEAQKSAVKRKRSMRTLTVICKQAHLRLLHLALRTSALLSRNY